MFKVKESDNEYIHSAYSTKEKAEEFIPRRISDLTDYDDSFEIEYWILPLEVN